MKFEEYEAMLKALSDDEIEQWNEEVRKLYDELMKNKSRKEDE